MNRENRDASDAVVVVHSINKRDNEQVRFSLSKYSGTEFIDIRSFFLAQDGSECRWKYPYMGIDSSLLSTEQYSLAD